MFVVFDPRDGMLIDLYSVKFEDRISSKLFCTCTNCGDDKCFCVHCSERSRDFFRHSKKEENDPGCPLGSDINNNPFNQNLLKCVDDSISKAYIYDLINVSNQVKICHSKIKKKQYNHIQIMLWMELC